MSKLRNLLAALGLLAAASGAWAQQYAPQEFDFSELAGMEADTGIVESVREVPVMQEIHAFDPQVLVHTMRPETVDEVVIRLDGGHVVTVTNSDCKHRLEPGQRVRVTLSTTGPLISLP
jgi:hypothetical protein